MHEWSDKIKFRLQVNMQGFKHTGWLSAFTTRQTNNKRNLKRCNIISKKRETSIRQSDRLFQGNPIATYMMMPLNLCLINYIQD